MSDDNQDRFGRDMHEATCSDCGATCQVPFAPTEGRPVYCRDCFQKHRKPRTGGGGHGGHGGGHGGGYGGGRGGRGGRDDSDY